MQSTKQKTSRALIFSLALLNFVFMPPLEGDVEPASAAGCTLSGDGSSATPYLISTGHELWSMLDCDAPGAEFRLENDLDFGDANTNSPIGAICDGNTFKSFTGRLNGNNKKIRGITINRNDCGSGLFEGLDGAEIFDLELQGTFRSTTNTADPREGSAGALAAFVDGTSTVSNISASVTVTGQYLGSGGLVGATLLGSNLVVLDSQVWGTVGSANLGFGGFIGYSEGDVRFERSTNSATLSADGYAGGFIGTVKVNSRIVVQDSSNLGPISTSTNFAGGLVAQQLGTVDVRNFQNFGAISGPNAGGLVGRSTNRFTFSQVINLGHITGTSAAGGFVGYHLDSRQTSIADSRNQGDISGGNYLGGAIGYSKIVSISRVVNSGEILGTGNYIGGLVGYVASTGVADLNDVTNSAPVTGAQKTGGILGGSVPAVTIRDAVNTGDISGTFDIGGLAGYIQGAASNLVDLQNFGDVLGGASARSGGIVGGTIYSPFADNLTNYGKVSVSGITYNPTGGIFSDVAVQAGSTQLSFSNLVNYGIVSSGNVAGGLIGKLEFKAANQEFWLEQSLNKGDVRSSGSLAGGLIGNVLSNAQTDTQLIISESANTATVSSGANSASGLIGNWESSDGELLVYNSANYGAISAATAGATGLIGSEFRGEINNFLSIGSVSSTVTSSPLFTSGTFSPTSSFYTTTDWVFGAAITAASLSDEATYIAAGWDFTTVWGISCDLYQGAPVLRWIHPSANFVSSCSPQVVSNANPGSNPTTPVVAIVPRYEGPEISNLVIRIVAGESAQLVGKRLAQVTEIAILGSAISFSVISDAAISISIPVSFAGGAYDLVLYSGFGRTTFLSGIEILAPKSRDSGTLIAQRWTLRFDGNSRVLSEDQEAHIRTLIARFSAADSIVCWGYTTSENPAPWAVKFATDRAQAACDLISQEFPTAKTYVRLRYGIPKTWALRSSLQFWESANK